MVPSPLHKPVQASGLGLPLTHSLPGETGCFPYGILPAFIPTPGIHTHGSSLNSHPPHYDLLKSNPVKPGTVQDLIYIPAASAIDFLVITR